MKKSNAVPANNSSTSTQTPSSTSEHIHASNCGHKSFMHGGHVDYLQDGRYFYMVDGKAYPCSGPGSPLSTPTLGSKKLGVVLPFSSKGNGKKK